MEPTLEDQAVELLRGMVQHAPTYQLIPPPILAWYLALRQRDLKDAMDGGTDSIAIVQDIATIEFSLDAANHRLGN